MIELRRNMMGKEIIEKVDHITFLDGARIDIPIPYADYEGKEFVYSIYREKGFLKGISTCPASLWLNNTRSMLLGFVGSAPNNSGTQIVGAYDGTSTLIECNKFIDPQSIIISYTLYKVVSKIRPTFNVEVSPQNGSFYIFTYGTNQLNTIGDTIRIADSITSPYADAQFKYLKLGEIEIFPAYYNGEYGVVCNGEFYGNSAGVGFVTF